MLIIIKVHRKKRSECSVGIYKLPLNKSVLLQFQFLYIFITHMDLPEIITLDITDFFEETSAPLRVPAPPSQIGESVFSHEAFAFNMEDSFNLFEKDNKLPLPRDLNFSDCLSQHEQQDIEDTNPLDDLANRPQEQPNSNITFILASSDSSSERYVNQSNTDNPSPQQLESIIKYLVQFSNLGGGQLRTQLMRRFGACGKSGVVETLIQKFSKLKKTKEELVKYCMRKAFKFILELPKNRHILNNTNSQKFSFSKCKNRYLKNISEQKSMNNKFLKQIFSDTDFAEDYQIFLQHFEAIMIEDNEKKVKYLAWLLTHQKEGKDAKSAEVVRRLPWTHALLQKVRKTSLQMLKFKG